MGLDWMEPAEGSRELQFELDRELSNEEQFDLQEYIDEKLVKGVDDIGVRVHDGYTMVQLVFTAKGAYDLDPETDRYAIAKKMDTEVELVQDRIVEANE